MEVLHERDCNICGSLLSLLGSPASDLRRFFGEDGRDGTFVVSSDQAEFNYVLCMINKKLYCALDFIKMRGAFLSVKPLAQVIDHEESSSAKSLICGQILKLAELFPYHSIISIAEMSSASEIILCGESYSGTIGHAIALTLNKLQCTRDGQRTVAKCISFSGMLCGSYALVQEMEVSGEAAYHLNINVNNCISDRLLFNFQRLSALTTSGNVEEWRTIYETIYKYASEYILEGKIEVTDSVIVAIEAAEMALEAVSVDRAHNDNAWLIGALWPRLTSNTLCPNLIYALDRDSMTNFLTECGHSAVVPPEWQSMFSFSSLSTDEKMSCDANFLGYALPQIGHATAQRFSDDSISIRIEGVNLDSTLKRNISHTVSIRKSDMSNLPFTLQPQDAFELTPDAKLVGVKASYAEAVITVSGLKFLSSCLMSVNTDFGCCRPFPFDIRKITDEKDKALSGQNLHPTMNADFLGCALLRVALCASHCRGLLPMADAYPALVTVWERLVDLENLGNFTEKVLEKQMDLFVTNRISIGDLRSSCHERLVQISEYTTEVFQVEESSFKRNFRKTLGGVSKVSGGILSVAGAIVSLPAVILSVPGILIANRQRSDNAPHGLSYRIGTGLYVGVLGIVGLPALIISSLGNGLRKAGEYAMKDSQTYEYKKILNMLMDMLGIQQTDVVDEVAPLEDCFVTSFAARFPGCDLSDCSQEELIATIKKAVSLGSISAAKFIETIKKVPIILTKMRLVGRIRSIRCLLQNTLMLAFIGMDNSGASTTLKRLFGVSAAVTPAEPLDGFSPSQPRPQPYELGQWIEQAASETPSLKSWFEKKERCDLHVYAVDFPGVIYDSDESIDATVQFAGVASMFIIFLTAGTLPAVEHKHLVSIAKSHHKPYLVLINKCDLIEDDIKNAGTYDALLDKYSSTLGVPSDTIHFVSSFDSYSNDKLRGILFGILQCIVGGSMKDTLALRFLPEDVVNELKQDSSLHLLSSTGTLSKAAGSLMFNLCPMTTGTVGDMYAMMLADEAPSLSRMPSMDSAAVTSKNILNLTFSTSDLIRQVAVSLHISDVTYSVFIAAFTARASSAMDQLVKSVVVNFSALPADLKQRMDNAISMIALAAMRDQINHYFGRTISPYAPSDAESLSREILVGIHHIIELWVERGYEQSVVAEVIRSVFVGAEPITDSAILTLLLQEKPRFNAALCHSVLAHKDELNSHGNLEFNKFSAAKDRLKQLSKVLLFQPLAEFAYSDLNQASWKLSKGETSVDDFRNHVKNAAQMTKREVLLSLTSSEQMVIEVINTVMSMSREKINGSNVRFQILSESAVDANGVTRAVLAKLAQEINAHPELVYMKKDEDSKLIYFDPNVCCMNVPATSAFGSSVNIMSIESVYRGLGRLIGLTLIKSNVGATFPVNFPITLYKLLLGHRIGQDDLSTISPQVANSIRSIALLDSESLNMLELNFVVSSGEDHKEYSLVSYGSSKIVTEHNVMSYVTELVKYYLCCKESSTRSDDEAPPSPLRQFLLGVQDFCPRDLFHSMSPVSLQTLLEGRREIDVEQWKLHTDISGSAADSTHTLQFWEVLSELDDSDKEKLLCFSIGTTSLPSKGFQELNPKFRVLFGGDDELALPTSHTCFHMLMIPKYSSKEVLKNKLLLAIRETDTAQMGIV